MRHAGVRSLYLHLADVPFAIENERIDSLSSEISANVVGSGHLGIVDPNDSVLSRVSERVFYRWPELGAGNIERVIVGFGEGRRAGKEQRNDLVALHQVATPFHSGSIKTMWCSCTTLHATRNTAVATAGQPNICQWRPRARGSPARPQLVDTRWVVGTATPDGSLVRGGG